MIYINKLTSLTPKVAELEAVPLIRELKEKQQFPLSSATLHQDLSPFFISEKVLSQIYETINLIDPALQQLLKLINLNDPKYNNDNLKRTGSILKELKEPLLKNITYLEQIINWQNNKFPQLINILNSIITSKTTEECKNINIELNFIFQTLLRNDNLMFNGNNIINEAYLAHIMDLQESMSKGYLFQTSMEDELKKVNVEIIRRRLSLEQLEPVDELDKQIKKISDVIKTCYNSNLLQVHSAIVIYAYVKWLSTSSLH